ncbi:DUF6198 family protein [Deltaproteobacteria bacterium OttesenSCG-928-K17]|nr:DUF6198 family protein [Deltaproteobacteria bacterium OttesenSCG-928-K17]
MILNHGRFFQRCILFLLGLSLVALGTALIIKADLGSPPVSVIPYVASLGFTPTVGVFTILLNVIFVAMQAAILRRKFSRTQAMQIPVDFLFGFILDFWMALAPVPNLMSYLHQWLVLISGSTVMAFGIFMLINANVLVTAGEGVVLALSLAANKEFGLVKITFDVVLIIIGGLLSFAMLSEIKGVREGTIVSAVLVGFFVKIFYSIKHRLE